LEPQLLERDPRLRQLASKLLDLALQARDLELPVGPLRHAREPALGELLVTIGHLLGDRERLLLLLDEPAERVGALDGLSLLLGVDPALALVLPARGVEALHVALPLELERL